jgi:hypothetical protein
VNLSNIGNLEALDKRDAVAKGPQKQKALDGIHDLATDSHDVIELVTIDVIMERKLGV